MLVAETTTGQYGDYWFPTVAPGDYYLEFDRPDGSGFTTPNVGDDALDSDVTDLTAGRTAVFTIGLGDVRDDLDAGVVYPLVGDRVWDDLNGNGLQDAGEPGLGGVTVRLLDSLGVVVGETATDPDGYYDFTFFDPGTYRLEFVAPAGKGFSPVNQGLDDSIDSDALPSGLTDLFTVAAADVRLDLDTGLRPLTVSVSDTAVVEGHSGTTTAAFTVSLSAASPVPVTVDYGTADWTATAGTDYQAAGGTVTFAVGETSQTVTVAVNGDTAEEPDEAFFLNLSNPTNATLADGQGVGTILNDDSLPTITIDDVSQREGDSGTTLFVFTFTLSSPSWVAVTVEFATADGTATAGSDYQATSGTLTFQPGETTKTITVVVSGDTAPEGGPGGPGFATTIPGGLGEDFFVNLSAPTNATLLDGQGIGFIQDDD